MPLPFRLIAASVLLALAPGVTAQEEEENAKVASYPPIYLTVLRDAMRAFTTRDFTQTIALVNKADGTFQVTPVALNIRGAVAIEERRFEEGRELCLKALKEDPKFFPARFNLCEIPFVQGKYAEAREMFQKLLDEYPKNDLLKFRVYLTYLLEKNETAAAEHLDRLPFLSNTPVYYYAQAAWAFAHGKPEDAKTWLDRGNYVFPPARHQNFIDVFYDIGWLQRPTAQSAEE
jgi:tetratricopeptide (TPR) repeat protein